MTRTTRIVALLGLLAFSLGFVSQFPATWILEQRSIAGMVRLVAVEGSIWRGSAQLSPESLDVPTPERLTWELGFNGVRPHLELRHPWLRSALQIRLEASGLSWTEGLLQGPMASMTPLIPRTQVLGLHGSFTVRWPAGSSDGWKAVVLLDALGSQLSPVRPLGSYVLEVDGTIDHAQVRLSSQSGVLSLEGQGQWDGQRLSFDGLAMPTEQATPGQRLALAGLLQALGPVTDQRTTFSIR